ncbi:hypothetical protein [Nonomuraea glycinis]|uniref:hypothetical protein n=1 Tax=Nonomuraea glycinis TaxID=2047744 RepID=UPI0033B022BD
MSPDTALVLYVIGINAAVIALLRSRIIARRRIETLAGELAKERTAHAATTAAGAADSAERKRLTARLDTLTTALTPIVVRARTGWPLFISRRDLATVTLLVEHPGPDGEQLVHLEQSFHRPA